MKAVDKGARASLMRMSLVFLALMLSMLISSCSTITDQDLADLQSSNTIVKKEALDRISRGQPFPHSFIGGFVNRGNKKRAVSLMVKLLDSGEQSKDVELSILKALGGLGQRVEVPVSLLVDKLRDDDPQVRAQAVETVGKTKNKEASTELVKMLKEERDNYLVVWALGEIGDPRTISALNRLLASKDKYLRYNAYRALAKMGPDQMEHAGDQRGLLDVGRIAFRKYQNVMLVVFEKIKGIKSGDAVNVKRFDSTSYPLSELA